jgi:hypothetical protein
VALLSLLKEDISKTHKCLSKLLVNQLTYLREW